jgi:hypothetical protein
MRIVSLHREPDNNYTDCLAVFSDERFVAITINNMTDFSRLTFDSLIRAIPNNIPRQLDPFESISYYNGVAALPAANRIDIDTFDFDRGPTNNLKVRHDLAFPKQAWYKKAIEDITNEKRPYVIDAVVLENPEVSNIFGDEEGEVQGAHTLLGDDSGEIRLVSLLYLNSSILDLKKGDRIRVICAIPSIDGNGQVELLLKQYSSILHIENDDDDDEDTD